MLVTMVVLEIQIAVHVGARQIQSSVRRKLLSSGILSIFTRNSEDPTHSGSAAHTLHRDQEKDLMEARPHRVQRAPALERHSVGCRREGRTVRRDGN